MRSGTLIAVAALALAALLPSSAGASRAPSKAEAAAIKRVALRACNKNAPSPCRYHRARVSTKNRHYAWADVTTDGFSAVLLKRPTTRSRKFKVIGTQGGGIGDCAYWRARAPRSVLRDLHVFGLLDDSGASGRCG